MIAIKHKGTGKVLFSVRADTLMGVDLDDAYIEDADLSGMDLTGANLGDSDLTGANLRDADLRGANLRGAWFIAADLTGAKLTGARYTPATRWPDGFDPAKHGAVLAIPEIKLRTPDDPADHRRVAHEFMHAGLFPEAIAAVREALRLEPSNAINHIFLAIATGNLDEAISAYREAVRLEPNSFDYRRWLGNTLERAGKRKEAAVVLRDARRFAGASPADHYLLGGSLWKAGLLDEARAEFAEGLTLHDEPVTEEAINRLILCHGSKA